MNPPERNFIIKSELFNLVDKLQKDYGNQKQKVQGYAILSYVDVEGSVKTIVLAVPKQ
jgi:hypothetical protein